MNNKTLGTIGLIGAPTMLIGLYGESIFSSLQDSWFTGAWGIAYITAWMATIVAMQRAKLTGDSPFGIIILWVVLVTLTVANISNLYQLLTPDNKPSFFWIIDLFWPLSNLLMIPTGIAIIRAKRVTGGKRYIALLAGLWFPFTMICLTLIGRTPLSFFISGLYSAIAWSALAVMVMNLGKSSRTSRISDVGLAGA